MTHRIRRVVSGLVSASLVLSGWPVGWLGARNPLATPPAEAAAGDVILLWDGVSIPSGWTCLSCNPGDAFYQLFPRAAATYGGTGGADTGLAHGLSLVSATQGAYEFCAATGAQSTAHQVHTHTWSGSTNADGDIRPPFQHLKLIAANNPSTLPAGIIGMFDVASTASLPANWTNYTAMNGQYLRTAGDINTGGAASHAHAASVTSGVSTTNSVGNAGSNIAALHTHGISGNTSAATNVPPFVEVVFAKLSVDSAVPGGLLALFDNASLPTGWRIVSNASPYQNNFLKGATSFGATGGAATHTHPNFTVTSSVPSATAGYAGGGSGCTSAYYHTHNVTYSTDAVSSLPAYKDIILGKAISVSGNVYSDEAATVWSGCDGATANISLVVNGGAARTTTCSASTGAYSFGVVSLAANTPVSVFINTGGKGVATTVAANATSDVTLNPRLNIAWLATETGVASITNTNLNHCDSDGPAQCANVPYSVSGTALTVENTVELHVEASKTFAPGGTVTTSPGGAGGDVHIGGAMTVGTNAVSVGGSWNNAGTFTKSSGQTTTFAATATGKTITPASSNFDALTFNGAGGGWTPQANLTADGTITVTNGTFEVGTTTVTAANVTVNGGTLSMTGSGGALKLPNNGVLSMSSGTIRTLDVATAPCVTASGGAGCAPGASAYYEINLTGGILDVTEWDLHAVKSVLISGAAYGNVRIGSGVTIGAFDNVTLNNDFQSTANTDAMLHLDARTATLKGHRFPASWSGGEYNVRLITSGLVKMLGAAGAFAGEATDCDSEGACASGTGLINWITSTTIENAILENLLINN